MNTRGSDTTHTFLPRNPLDALAADHQAEREICDTLERLADADTPDAGDMARALAFFRMTLPVHLADEEQDLFPLLHRRCLPEDEIARAIGRLTSDHGHAAEDTPRIVAILERLCRDGRPPDARDRAALATYATEARRHLGLENAVILPLARLRLLPADLRALRRAMRARRGPPGQAGGSAGEQDADQAGGAGC